MKAGLDPDFSTPRPFKGRVFEFLCNNTHRGQKSPLNVATQRGVLEAVGSSPDGCHQPTRSGGTRTTLWPCAVNGFHKRTCGKFTSPFMRPHTEHIINPPTTHRPLAATVYLIKSYAPPTGRKSPFVSKSVGVISWAISRDITHHGSLRISPRDSGRGWGRPGQRPRRLPSPRDGRHALWK